MTVDPLAQREGTPLSSVVSITLAGPFSIDMRVHLDRHTDSSIHTNTQNHTLRHTRNRVYIFMCVCVCVCMFRRHHELFDIKVKFNALRSCWFYKPILPGLFHDKVSLCWPNSFILTASQPGYGYFLPIG